MTTNKKMERNKRLKKKYLKTCSEKGVESSSSVLLAIQLIQDGCIDLSSIHFDHTQCKIVGHILQKSPVTELLLSNCLLGDEGILCLLPKLQNMNNLTTLNLKGNNLLESGLEIGAFLKVNQTLEQLSLEWNNLGGSESSITGLAEGVAINKSLLSINLSSNKITQVGMQALASALMTNDSLVELDLRWNSAGVSGARSLLNCLKLNSSLEQLYLTGNNVTDDILEAIETTLSVKEKQNHTERVRQAERELMLSQSRVMEEQNELTLSQLETEFDEMRQTSMNLTQKAHTEITVYKGELMQCHTELENLENKLLIAKGALDMSESMYSELQQTYTQMQADHDIKLQENAITLQEMNKEISALNKSLKQSEDAWRESKHKLQIKIAEERMMKEKAEQDLAFKIEELKQSNERSSEKLKELQTEFKSQCTLYSDQLAQERRIHEEQMKEARKMWESEKNLLEKQLQHSNTRIMKQQQDLENESYETNKEKTKHKQEIEQLKQDYLTKESDRTKRAQEELMKVKREHEKLKHSNAELHASLQQAQFERNNLEEELKQKTTQHDHTRKLVEELQTQALTSSTKYIHETEDLRKTKRRYETLSETLQMELHDQKEDNQRLKKDLQQQIHHKNERIQTLEKSLEDVRQQLKQFQLEETTRARQLKQALETYVSSATHT